MSKELQQALNSAYDVCVVMADHTGNVIASDGKENASKQDRQLNLKAKKYISWYNKTFKK